MMVERARRHHDAEEARRVSAERTAMRELLASIAARLRAWRDDETSELTDLYDLIAAITVECEAILEMAMAEAMASMASARAKATGEK